MATQLVRGVLVREMLRQGPLPVPRAIAVARDIAGALAEAHRARIVHRDLKPETVMITMLGIAAAPPDDTGALAFH